MANSPQNRKDKDVTLTFLEVTITKKPSKFLKLRLNDQEVKIPVEDETYAYFTAEFLRQNPTQKQRLKYATVMKLLVAAYGKGHEDGMASKKS